MVRHSFVFPQISSLLKACTLVTFGISGLTASAFANSDSEKLVDQLVIDSQKHQYKRQIQTNDPLFQAELTAADLATDIGEYNRLMVEIVSRHAAGALPDEAYYLASKLPASGPAMAWSKIAYALAKKGQADRAKTALDQLSKHLWGINGQKLQEINGVRAEVLLLIGEKVEAEGIRHDLGAIELLELDTRLQKDSKASLLTLEKAKARLELCDAKGIDRLRARFLLACAEQHFKQGQRDNALAFLPEVGRLATSEGLPTAQYVLLDLARVCWAGGESKEALKAINVFFKCAELFPDVAGWKSIYLAEAAQILWQWGKKDEAKTWFQKSLQCLPKVFILEAPQSFLAVAKVAETMDSTDLADSLAAEVAKMALAHQNPEPRAAAQVQVYLYYADAGRPVPNATLELLKSQNVQVKQ